MSDKERTLVTQARDLEKLRTKRAEIEDRRKKADQDFAEKLYAVDKEIATVSQAITSLLAPATEAEAGIA